MNKVLFIAIVLLAIAVPLIFSSLTYTPVEVKGEEAFTEEVQSLGADVVTVDDKILYSYIQSLASANVCDVDAIYDLIKSSQSEQEAVLESYRQTELSKTNAEIAELEADKLELEEKAADFNK